MSFKRISCGQAKELFDNPALNVADIRDPNSYSQGHIKGAARVDNDNLQEFMQGAPKDDFGRQKPVIKDSFLRRRAPQGRGVFTGSEDSQ